LPKEKNNKLVNKTVNIAVYLNILDEVLWQDIDRIIFENGYSYIVDEDNYMEMLAFLYRRLRRTWFGRKNPSPEQFRRRLKYYYTRKRTELLAVVSYLVSLYYNSRRMGLHN